MLNHWPARPTLSRRTAISLLVLSYTSTYIYIYIYTDTHLYMYLHLFMCSPWYIYTHIYKQTYIDLYTTLLRVHRVKLWQTSLNIGQKKRSQKPTFSPRDLNSAMARISVLQLPTKNEQDLILNTSLYSNNLWRVIQ